MGVHGEADIFGELLYCYFLRIVVNGNDNTAYILEHSDSPAKSIERTQFNDVIGHVGIVSSASQVLPTSHTCNCTS